MCTVMRHLKDILLFLRCGGVETRFEEWIAFELKRKNTWNSNRMFPESEQFDKFGT